MSTERYTYSALTPVKVPELGDLDGGQSNRTIQNGDMFCTVAHLKKETFVISKHSYGLRCPAGHDEE